MAKGKIMTTEDEARMREDFKLREANSKALRKIYKLKEYRPSQKGRSPDYRRSAQALRSDADEVEKNLDELKKVETPTEKAAEEKESAIRNLEE